MKKKYFIITLLALAFPQLCNAATTGKLSGIIVDQATNDPLPGVTVLVVGTGLQAITGPKGNYFVLNVPAGVYEVEARMIGYVPIRTSSVGVSTDLTTRVDFHLETTILDYRNPVVITATKPLIRTDLTSAGETITLEELRVLQATDLSDLILLQTGVVRDAHGSLHVRGGRNDEISYYIDGAPMQDPLLGGLGSHIQMDSIEELVINRGGFDAEYGAAMSGVVNVVTREGSQKLSGRFRAVATREFQYNVQTGSYDRRLFGQGGRVEGFLSGTLPKSSNRGSFALSAQRMVDGLYIPHHSRTITTAAANLVYRPHSLVKVKLNGHMAKRQQRLYDHRNQYGISYDFNLDGLPERHDNSNMINLSVTHTLSPKTFYTARVYRYVTDSKLAPTMLFNRYWTEWPGYATDADNRYNGTIYETNLLRSSSYENLPFTTGSDFYPLYRSTRSTYYGFRMDLNSQVNSFNQVRAGLEMQWYRLRWDEKSFLEATPSGQHYSANPVEGAIFLQDKIELSRFIVNAGARLDYFDTGQRFFLNLPNGRSEIRNSPTKTRISPRVGISYRLTSRALLRANYGYFYQAPEFRFAFENLQNGPGAENEPIGNPSLEPQKTVAYETGVEYALSERWRAVATFSVKSISNLTAATQVQYPGGSYTLFSNADYGSVSSFEFSLKRSLSGLVSGSINYTYAIAEGSASEARNTVSLLKRTTPAAVIGTGRVAFPLAFDQRHTVSTILTILTPPKWKTRFIGPIFRDISLTAIIYWGSGLPYTPTNSIGERIFSTPNSARLPAWMNVDLQARKRFGVGKRTVGFVAEARNVFNRRNVIGVYSNTGSPSDDGYTQENFEHQSPTFVQLRRLLSLDPQHFSPPREIRIGLETDF